MHTAKTNPADAADIRKDADGATCCALEDAPVFLREEQTGTLSQHESIMHWHKGLEILRVENGEMDCQVNEQVNRLHEGEMCLINSGRMHRNTSANDASCTYQVMLIDPEQLTRDEAVFERYIRPVLENEQLDFLLGSDCPGTAGEVCKLIDRIASLQSEKPRAYELEVIALAHLVFKQLYLRFSETEMPRIEQASPDELLLRQMTSYVYQNFGERIGLSDIAEAGGVSRSKCSAVFRSELDTSPMEFLNRYRLEVSAQMLSMRGDSISRIAAACGFSQQSYFNRVFLREYGCTPKEYRARHRVA